MIAPLSTWRGELAALSAALIWAVASLIYARVGQQLSPLLLNFVKGLIAIVLLVATLALQWQLFPPVPGSAVGVLLLSGVVGIGLGDTAYFAALNHLGARRTLVLEALAPPLAAVLALMALNEQLIPMAWIGIALTVAGVVWVVLERSPLSPAQPLTRPLQGIVYGLLAALGQASGAVLSRSALVGTDINPLWSTLVRLLGGMVVLLFWLALQRRSLDQLKALRSGRFLRTVSLTAFASTYLGIWLQQLSLKYAPAGIAQSLIATSPLFVIPFAMAMGERVSLRAMLGVLVALAGIWLLFSQPG